MAHIALAQLLEEWTPQRALETAQQLRPPEGQVWDLDDPRQ